MRTYNQIVMTEVRVPRDVALRYIAELDRLSDHRLPFEVVDLALRLQGGMNTWSALAFEATSRAIAAAPAEETFTVHVPDHWRIGADGSIDTGNEFVAAIQERARQIDVEGWTPEHDDKHIDGQLALAAASYAINVAAEVIEPQHPDFPTLRKALNQIWPWCAGWWKPKNRLRDLDKAMALLAAERGRLKRLEWAKDA